MNKSLIRILLAGALFFTTALTGCQKEGIVTLKAKMGHFNSQGKVTIDQTTPYWQNNDTVVVNSLPYQLALTTDGGARLEVPTAPSFWAIYPAEIFTSVSDADRRINITLPPLQPYFTASNNRQAVKAPIGAYLGTSGSTLTFTNLGALLAISIVNNTDHSSITVDSVSVRATAIPLWGDGYISNYDQDTRYLALTSSLSDHDSVVLARPGTSPDSRSASMGLQVSRHTPATVYVYVPSTLTPNRYSITVHANANGTPVTRRLEQSQANPNGGSLPLNSLADVEFPLGTGSAEQYPEGAIHGRFTVGTNDDGTPRQVYFSQGNLQYQASTNTFRFAEHQYDWIGNNAMQGTVQNCNNHAISQDYTGWIDLFGWGTSGYGTCKPYNYESFSNYYPNVPSLSGDNVNYDWGYYNAISNGGNQPHLWRTLSSDEWNYLLTQRLFDEGTHAGNNYSYKRVVLNNSTVEVAGLLLFPDGYTEQTMVQSQISEIPEGCVFIPAKGGYRTYMSNMFRTSNIDYGYYWSATRGSQDNKAKYFGIPANANTQLTTSSAITTQAGLKVRLVYELE